LGFDSGISFVGWTTGSGLSSDLIAERR